MTKNLLLAALSALAFAACVKGAAAPACNTGESNRCACAGGGEGLQQCLPSRESFGACVCADACTGGAACVAMPDVVGKDMDGAGAAIDAAQLQLPDPVDPLQFIAVQQINDPPVQVLAQDPAPGTPLKPGTRVKLTVTVPPDQESLGLPNSNFLVGRLKQDTEQSALDYYSALDPGVPTRATFADWKEANGFGTPADAEASAIYVTHADLGFGRHMHMRRKGRRVAFYVDNYPTLEDAIAGTRFFATVAMEFSPGPHGRDTDPFFTQFYTFNKKGERISDPILDGHGPKNTPGVCLVCHGGSTDQDYAVNGGNVGAHFIPFDVDAEEFSTRPGYRRADQEWAFKLFNEAVQATWDPADPAYPPGDPPPVIGLVDGWYGGPGHPSPTFLTGATPIGWDVSLQAHDLYHSVFARSCQTCHSQREAFRNFSTYAKFEATKPLIEQRVFDEGAMPLSEKGSRNFWLSYPHQPTILANWLGTTVRSPGKPLARVSVSPSAVVTAGTTVTFDASDSQFARVFTWKQTSGIAVQLANLTPNGSKVSFVTPASGTNIAFELTTSVLERKSAPFPVSVLSRSAPDAPVPLAVTPGAGGTATVQWTVPEDDGLSPITGYTVSASPGGPTLSVGPAVTSAVIGGLQPGLTYTFSVVAVNAIGTSPAALASLRFPTVPARPVGVSAVSTHTGSTLLVSWTPPADDGGAALTGFTVSCAPSGSASAGANATSVSVTGLANGSSFTCTVKANNVVGSSPPSLGASATPDGPPAVPINFTATSGGGANWNLSWNAPADTGGRPLLGYVATWSPATTVPSRSLPVTPTAVTLGAAEGLQVGVTYTFSLAALNSVGTGVAATTTPPGKPTITSPVAGASTAAGSIPVTWTAAAPNGSSISSYVVQAQVAPAGAITQTTVSGATLSATVIGLSNCTAYNVTVIAVSGGGSTASDPINNVTPRQPPSVPAGLTLSKGAGVGDFIFGWGGSSQNGCGTVSYTVQVFDPVIGFLSPLGAGTSTSIAFNTTTPACPYNSVNCSSPRQWSFEVSASNAGGSSGFSAFISGTPKIGYIRDSIWVIWGTTLAGGTCLGCHSAGNPLIFSDGGDTTHATSFNNIRNTTNIVFPGSPLSSFLHLCPTQSAGCTPPGFTNHPGGQRYVSGSQEDQVITRWITDGALF